MRAMLKIYSRKFVNKRRDFRALAIWFLLVFVYAISAMILVREIMIPHIFPASVGGNLPADPQYYNDLAFKKAAEIEAHGFVAFELRPSGQGAAGLPSLLYVIVNKSPYIVVLVNAFMHALSAVVMVLIILCWFPLRTSIIAAIPLAISPYMILWFSQLNKDSYSLLGALLFVYGMLQLVLHGKTLQNVTYNVLVVISGALLIWLMRPYVNLMLMPIATLLLMVALVWRLRNKSTTADLLRFVTAAATILFFLGVLSKGAQSDETLDSLLVYQTPTVSSVSSLSQECLAKIDSKYWRNEPFLPDYLNNKLQAMMGQRCLIFSVLDTQTNPTTLNSFIDKDVLPGSSLESLFYLPRAALIGVFSPWPDRWVYWLNHETSIFYMITSIEAVLMYLGIAGLIIYIVRHKVWPLTIPISIAFTMMVIYGMANPFIGALYRYRYPWWMIFICLGTAALIELSRNRNRKWN
jgi:putative peptidoglycan lipid II flippase